MNSQMARCEVGTGLGLTLLQTPAKKIADSANCLAGAAKLSIFIHSRLDCCGASLQCSLVSHEQLAA